MQILIACETSGKVREAFRELGHDAFSCDILPAKTFSPYHIVCDVRELLSDKWDMVIAFPPCTHLAVSGARWFPEKIKDGRQKQGVDLFMEFAFLPNVPKVVIENPIGIMSTRYRRPDQIIHPWQFGHGETKATCLWIKGLNKLTPTNIVSGRENRIHKMPPSKNRGDLRSVTYDGIAKAMADQWGRI